MKRIYESGAHKRQKAKRSELFIESLPKVTSFFQTVSGAEINLGLISDHASSSSDRLPVDRNATFCGPSSSPLLNVKEAYPDSSPSIIYNLQNSVPVDHNVSSPGPSPSSSLLVNVQEAYPDSSPATISDLQNSVSHEKDEIRSCVEMEPGKDVEQWELFRGSKNELQEYWIRKGPSSCQNFHHNFIDSVRKYECSQDSKKVIESRTLHPSMFFRELQTGEKIRREWLLYSPSSGRVYCFVCKLFGSNSSSPFCSEGFNDWKHATQSLTGHENGKEHRNNMLVYLRRCKEVGRIDTALQIEINKECEYWQNVLVRVVSVVRFLAERGLPFRGDQEKFGNPHNGNYLGSLELISEYDPFLKEHIKKYGNTGRGNVSYLSSFVCDEFIEVMGRKVFDQIVLEVKEAKYYSICVDSTPDVAHTDQLTFIIRYVINSETTERFLKFIAINGHSAETLFKEVTGLLRNCGILLENCRGQSYDNASNMSGKYTGLQARIKQENPLAEFIPCSSHSLNLVGVVAAESNQNATKYFDFIQSLYNFFSASTSRWNILLSAMTDSSKKLKPLSNTRWSARADAVLALSEGYEVIESVLDAIRNDTEQYADTKLKAAGLKKCMERFETVFLTYFWNDILGRINKVNTVLQKPSLTLSVAVKVLESLKSYVEQKRGSFDSYESSALASTENTNSENSEERTNRRSTRLTFFDNSSNPDTILKGRDKLRVETYLPIIDSLVLNLNIRTEAYRRVMKIFGFLEDLIDLQEDKLKICCDNLASVYKQDVNKSELVEECLHLKSYLTENKDILQLVHLYNGSDCANSGEAEGEINIVMYEENLEGGDDVGCRSTPTKKLNLQAIYHHLYENGLLPAFPNVEISLRMFLSMMVSNASGERSFSKLKIIKNIKRSAMQQERLNSLSILSIECDILRTLDFSDVIKDFASKKCRKKPI